MRTLTLGNRFLVSLFLLVTYQLPGGGQTIYMDSKKWTGKDIVPYLEEAIANGVRKIKFSQGVFTMKSLFDIENKDNITIVGKKSQLNLEDLPNQRGPAVIKLFNTKHIKIKGIVLNSNRQLYTTDRLLHAIFVFNSSDIVFTNIEIINSLGDGMQIAADIEGDVLSTNIELRDCLISNSTRNALSLIHCSDIRIYDSGFTTSNGASPQTGIDIEPDKDHVRPGVYNVLLQSLEIYGNKGNGIAIPYVGASEKITIKDCNIHQNSSGIYTCGVDVTIIGNTITDNENYGINCIRYPEHNIPPDSVVIKSNIITNHKIGIYYRGLGGFISDNTITNTSDEGIELRKDKAYQSSAMVCENTLKEIKGQSAIASDLDTLEVRQNIIENCRGNGIALHGGRNIVFGNQLTGCGEYSILVNNALSDVVNNTIRDGKKYFIWFNGIDHTRTGGTIEGNKLYSEKPLNGPYILDTSGRISSFQENLINVPKGAIDNVQLKTKPVLFGDKNNQVQIIDKN